MFSFKDSVLLLQLELSENQLKNIEKDNFFNLSNLFDLNLSNNRLSITTYNTFYYLKNLNKLSLENNLIVSIELNFFN